MPDDIKAQRHNTPPRFILGALALVCASIASAIAVWGVVLAPTVMRRDKVALIANSMQLGLVASVLYAIAFVTYLATRMLRKGYTPRAPVAWLLLCSLPLLLFVPWGSLASVLAITSTIIVFRRKQRHTRP